jgi:shikimate kinase
MAGQAEALCHGAATILNAIPTGMGAAFGVDLWTRAKVRLTDEAGVIEGRVVSDVAEDSSLIRKTVERVFRYFDVEGVFGARVETSSNIPIAKGLKSSSAAANAVALATVAALGKSLNDLKIVDLAVDGAFDARVTITGAFDDANASYFGGVVITDNVRRRILKRIVVSDDPIVLFHVPPKKSYTINTDVGKLQGLTSLTKIAYSEACHGNYWAALSFNGLIYSAALGYDPSIALDALRAGAVAAGLSGKGPAVTAVVPTEKVDEVKTVWQAYDGTIMCARVNHEKATVTG